MLTSFYRIARAPSFFQLCCALIFAGSAGPAAPAQEADAPLVVAALGDSISAGFNAQRFGDNRDLSWATGTNAKVRSHLQRLQQNLRRQAVGYNEAIAGSFAVNLDRQVNRLLPRKPDYVTISIGANDVCNWDSDWEDKLAEYDTKVRGALTKLVNANQNVRVVLSTIPDLYKLWEVAHTHPGCQAKWDLAALCRPMLSSKVTEEGRQGFVRRWEAANQTLGRIARDYQANVLFNAEAVHTKFEWHHVSPMDCFHPSIDGQNLLADTSWQLIQAVQ